VSQKNKTYLTYFPITLSQVIRFIMWWWRVVQYKNTPLGQLISFLKTNVNFKHRNLQALPQLYEHSIANIKTTIIQMQSNTNTTHKFIQIIEYSIKRFIQSSRSLAFHSSSSNVTYDQRIRNNTLSLNGHADQFPAIDTHNGCEKLSSIQKVRPAPVHKVQMKTPQLTIILMAKLQHKRILNTRSQL